MDDVNHIRNKYISFIEKKYKEFISWYNKIYNQQLEYHKFLWTDSRFQERLLRFGIEFKIFKLELFSTKEIEKFIQYSLLEDLMISYKFIERGDWTY